MTAQKARVSTYDDLDKALFNKTDLILEATEEDWVAEFLSERITILWQIGHSCYGFAILHVMEGNSYQFRESAILESDLT